MFKLFTRLCLCAFITMLALHNTEAEDWMKVDGTQKCINFITIDNSNNSKIIIGSDQFRTDFAGLGQISFPQSGGEGFSFSNDSGKTFSEPGLVGYNVYDIYVSPNETKNWYASIRAFNLGSIIVSTDAGESWNEDNKRCESTAQIIKIKSLMQNNTEKFYAAANSTSNGFRTSDDGFINCIISDSVHAQARDFKVSPVSPNLMFIAGDNFDADNGQFMRSTDYGKSWKAISLGNSNYRTLCVMPSPTDPAVVFIGVDSITATEKFAGIGIMKSIDTGSTWTKVNGINAARIFDIQIHPSNPNMMAAAGDSSGVWVSDDGGNYWEQKRSGFPTDVSVRKIAIPNWQISPSGMIVFAGTLYSGLYKSNPLTVGVSDKITEENSLKVYPNPVADKFRLNIPGNLSGRLIISMYDMTGNKLTEIYNGRADSYSVTEFNVRNYVPGIYTVVVDLNGNIQATTLSINR